MYVDWKDRLYRVSVLLVSLAIAAGVLWRGRVYSDGPSSDLLTPVMCAAAALFVVMTGVALSLRGAGETETD